MISYLVLFVIIIFSSFLHLYSYSNTSSTFYSSVECIFHMLSRFISFKDKQFAISDYEIIGWSSTELKLLEL